MLAIVCLSVCVCVLFTWSLTDLSTSKFIMGSQLWWAFFAFLAAGHRAVLFCSINFYCTLANKYDDDDDVQVRSARTATSTNEANSKTRVTLNRRRQNSSVRHLDDTYLGGQFVDWCRRDQLAGLPVLPACRRSLSPSRQLAVAHIAATDHRTPEQLMKALESVAGGGRGVLESMVKRSVLDIERLRRRTDKRRSEVGLHLVAHDPHSWMFRSAALDPLLPSYQLAPRHPSFHRWRKRLWYYYYFKPGESLVAQKITEVNYNICLVPVVNPTLADCHQ